MSAERVELFLSCQDLTSSHAFVNVYLKDNQTQHFNEIGSTDISYNSNPKYTTQFLIDFIFEEEQQLRFDIYKSVHNTTAASKKNLLGSCAVKLSEVIHSKCQMLTRTLTNGRKVVKNRSTKRYSRLNIRLEPVSSDVNENVQFQFAAADLPKQGTFSKCNPVLEIHRLGSDGKYFKVFETEKLHKNLNPQWQEFQITLQKLCNNETVRALQLKIFHADKDIRKYVGKTQTNYYQMKDERKNSFDLKNTKGKLCGTLQCVSLKVLSSTRSNNNNNNAGLTRADTMGYANQVAMEQKEQQMKKQMQKSSSSQSAEQKHVRKKQEIVSARSRGQFLRFLQGACEISLMVSVDFTGSNGFVDDAKSLHYIAGATPSPYQSALRTICNIVAPYDSDQSFPVWGFGAKFPKWEQVVNDFPLSPNGEEVKGVSGIEQAYLTAIKSGAFQLSGPTLYSPILAKAINICIAEHNKVVQDPTEPIQYFIFLLLTNGNISEEDKQPTKDLIVYASNNNLPLSLIIIGVGDGKFEFLNELDADFVSITDKNGNKAERDIVQFVPMQKFVGKPLNELSKYTLREVPIQFISYTAANNLAPRREQIVEHNASSGHNEVEDEEHDENYSIPLDRMDTMNDEDVQEFKSDSSILSSSSSSNSNSNAGADEHSMPVPPGWEKSSTASGRVFYIDHQTRKTQWHHPLRDQMAKSQQQQSEQAVQLQKKQQQLYMQRLVERSNVGQLKKTNSFLPLNQPIRNQPQQPLRQAQQPQAQQPQQQQYRQQTAVQAQAQPQRQAQPQQQYRQPMQAQAQLQPQAAYQQQGVYQQSAYIQQQQRQQYGQPQQQYAQQQQQRPQVVYQNAQPQQQYRPQGYQQQQQQQQPRQQQQVVYMQNGQQVVYAQQPQQRQQVRYQAQAQGYPAQRYGR